MKASGRPSDGEPEAPRLSFLTRLIATGLFTGYIPWASGSFGSLLGCAVVLVPWFREPWFSLPLIIAGLALGVMTSARVAAVEGHRLTRSAAATKAFFQPRAEGEPDPSIVVIDEIVGMWISLFLIPVGISTVVTAFVLFRLFDILKPPPANRIEGLPRGWGIMLDDVIAGVYANIGTRLLLCLIPGIMHP